MNIDFQYHVTTIILLDKRDLVRLWHCLLCCRNKGVTVMHPTVVYDDGRAG